MTIQQIYNLAIKMGIEADPRGKVRVLNLLVKEKANYKDLVKEDQKEFDQERFTNPYSDTRILNGNANTKVKRIMVGVDISVADLLLADRLSQKKEKIDLVISHHPLGKALARLDDVVSLQAEFIAGLGVPINIAESLVDVRVEELGRKLSPGNTNRPIDAAKLLDLPLMSTHTIADNLVYSYLNHEIDKKKPDTLKELIKLIKNIPEYAEASKLGIGPKIFNGKINRHCGKIALTEITGGTSGSKQMYEKLSQAGVGTVVGMHMEEDFREEAQKHHLNVVIAGHMSSDSLGVNLFLDELEKRGIEIVPCSGLTRVARN